MMTKNDNLKCCPFCGREAVLEEVKTVRWRGGKAGTFVRYRAQCSDPACLGHHNRLCVDKDTAIKKWNTRHKPVKKDVKNMINRSAGMHMIQPETNSKGYDIYPSGAAYIPEFTTAREFADAKIEMLREQFCIRLTKEDTTHLRSLKTENEINAAVKSIINKYWE